MAFFNEISRIFHMHEEDVFGGTSLIMGGNALYVEGVRRIKFIGTEQIELCCLGFELFVAGNCLQIVEIGGDACAIHGDICCLEKRAVKK